MKRFIAALLVITAAATSAFAIEALPVRTGFGVKTETGYDAYASARTNRYGAAFNYQNLNVGVSVGASTGYGLLRTPVVRTETQYFGVSAAYRLVDIADVQVGVTGEFMTMPPFRTVLAEQAVAGGVIPQGVIEGKTGVIFQIAPIEGLSAYAGPAFLLFDGGRVYEHGFGGFAGLAVRLTENITVSGDVVGAERPHFAGSVAYHF